MKEDLMRYLIMDNISEGIIAVGRDKKIKVINKSAKEIFGIAYKESIGHKEGKISKGDIVIIGDNSIGFDDGGINGEDLKLIGIEEYIPEKSALVYIGRYRESGEYKYVTEPNQGQISLSKELSGMKLEVKIDFIRRTIEIKIDNIEFPYSFIKGIGHIVILDEKTLEVKFYQSKGYSVRKEDLRSILNGKSYMGKTAAGEMELDVLDKSLTDVFGESRSIELLLKCAAGNIYNYIDEYDEINGRPVKCSIFSLKNGVGIEGAFLKVEDLSEVSKLIKEKDEILKKLMDIEAAAYDPFNVIVGESSKINKLKSYAKKAALSSLTVLISGESGTGKSLIARAIHEYSRRKDKKFVELNCGALSENLLESELFGYVPGAFTGANKQGKKGLIEYAKGGTIFLDEISEMPSNLQVKLLHVLQNKRIIPVGGTDEIIIDVRFICASNKDLMEMVEEGGFREDLFYRINIMPLMMPPLRDRKEDLYSIAQSIIIKICKRDNLHYKILSNEALAMLYDYDFPGNIRELENILERAISFSEGQHIKAEDIFIPYQGSETIKTLEEFVEEAEKKAIINYLRKYNGDKQTAMDALGIKKTAFYEKIKKYGIKIVP